MRCEMGASPGGGNRREETKEISAETPLIC